MKKIIFTFFLVGLTLILSGCVKTVSNAVKTADMVGTANSITQDSQNAKTVDSEENINNVIKMMNYEGLKPEDNQKIHDVIKKGMADGKTSADMDRNIINDSTKNGDNFGTGYMLGYQFGCQAIKDTATCQKESGEKYQQIFLEAMQKIGNAAKSGDSTTVQEMLVPKGAK